MRLSKLPYLTLWAVKFDDMLRLYKDIMGLPVAEENQNFVMFNTAGSRLAFHRLPKGHQLNRPTVEIHFQVNDVDTVYSSLQTKGVRFEEKPENKPWGTRAASFKDPEGFTVELIGPLKEEASAKHG